MIVRATVLLAGALLALAAAAPASEGGQLTLVDDLGRTVTVPGRVQRVISLVPEVTRIIVALGAADRLVGLDHFLRYEDRLFGLVAPGAARLPVISNRGQGLAYERALGLRPDIVFASPSEFGLAASIEKKLRAPVVAVASTGRIRALLEEIKVLGLILDREDRAARLSGLFTERLGPLDGEAGGSEDRPSVYLAFWGSLVRTPVVYDPVDIAGGRNVAAGLLPDYLGAAGATVSIERLLVWDPEIILIHGSYPPAERRVTVEGVLKDPRLASLRAVRNGRVHYTFGYWYWWDPALVLVEVEHLRRLFGRSDRTAADPMSEGDRIFKEFYGVDGAYTALCRVLRCHEWSAR